MDFNMRSKFTHTAHWRPLKKTTASLHLAKAASSAWSSVARRNSTRL
jgi:hypothetical protein